jgi:hypothetical protein
MATGVPQILRGLRCDRASNDRRQYPRVGLRARVTFEPIDRHQRRGPARQAWMRDISEGGAGLLVPDELRAGESLVLHVPLGGDRTAPVRCRVVHCGKAGACWRAGVEFVGKPWPDQKSTLFRANMSAPPATVATDPR